MLIEIHMLQNHAPSNLNRDDTGSPKDCVFGGVKRARISSQCLKRSLRRSEAFQEVMSTNNQQAWRTRRLPELVRKRLVEAGLAEDVADVASRKASGFGTKEGTEQKELRTAQTMFLTETDIAAVTETLLAAAKEAKTASKLQKIAAKDLQEKAQERGFRPITPDIALFGRMITSEAFRNVEASAQVAHAISTHKVDTDFDYFTAVDDLKGPAEAEEDAGADMLGDIEFNSACYYKYFSVDLRGLVDNLTAKSAGRTDIPADEQAAARKLAAETIAAFLTAAVTVTPTGKQNTFAAHQLPAVVLVEVRPACTPVSYANAFVEPARRGSDCDLVTASMQKLGAHVEALTSGFNLQANPRLLLAPEHPGFTVAGVERVPNLNTMCSHLREVMNGG